MKTYSLISLSIGLLCCSQSSAQNTDSDISKARSLLQGNGSLRFEQNAGQVRHLDNNALAAEVKFVVKSGNHKIFLLNNGLAHQFEQLMYTEGYDPMERDPQKILEQEALREQIQLKTYRMDMQLLGANPQPRITTEGKSAQPVRYYKEHTYTTWSWEQVTYHEVYPGIDWVVYSRGNELKYDFVVHPGADPSLIQLKLIEAEEAHLESDGSFSWSNPMGWVTENKPLSLQNGQEVESQYRYSDGILQFKLGAYNHTQILRIDPSLQWGTYYGGSRQDQAYGIATDASGNVFVTGYTSSNSGIATTGAHQSSIAINDAFVAKFNSGGALQWGTYYGGGSSEDYGYGIATDGSGNVMITGRTSSDTGIATTGAHQSSRSGNYDAFVAKFNSSGVLQWGTYYGGSSNEEGYGIASDDSGNVLVTGFTVSDTGIATTGAHQSNYAGNYDAFVAKFNNSGVLQWGTYFGGSSDDEGWGITTDGSGNVMITGRTNSSSDIASSGSHQSNIAGNYDAFVAKFNNSGVLQWGTYYGGTYIELSQGITMDGSGNVMITGRTKSNSGIASSGAHQNRIKGREDAFMAKFSNSGALQWGTYYGGYSEDQGYGITTDGSGNVIITGRTNSSSGIATTGVHQSRIAGREDVFVAKFSNGGALQWGTYYGGNGADDGNGITTDGSGNVLVTGYTFSSSGIASSGSHQSRIAGSLDAFVAKFNGGGSTVPQIANHPKNHAGCAGSSAFFGSTVSGTFDSLQWQQYKGSTWERVKGGTDTFCIIGSTDTSMNGDSIRVIAYSAGGNDTSAVAALNVYKLTMVISEPKDSTSSAGTGASFSLEAEGRNLRYQWQVNTGSGWTLVSGNPYSGENTATLSLSTTDTPMDGYLYRCLVTGDCNRDTSEAAELQVYRMPLIISQTPYSPALVVFPNPGTIFFQFDAEHAISEIRLFDLRGKELFRQYPEARNYLLQHTLKSGIYIAQVQVNGQWVQQKLIVE